MSTDGPREEVEGSGVTGGVEASDWAGAVGGRRHVALGALERARERAASRGEMRTSVQRLLRGTGGDSRGGEQGLDGDDLGASEGAARTEAGDGAPGSSPSAVPGVLRSVAERTRASGGRWSAGPGMAGGRLRYREPRPAGSVLEGVMRSRGWGTALGMGEVMAKWPTIVSEEVARHCVVETFDDHVLVVRCSSTAWAKTMTLLLPQVERRIAEEVGPGVVRQVVVRGPVAPSWKKGPWSVPGRGPRDTYG